MSPREKFTQGVFNSAKGLEWTVSDNWLDEYISHCAWHGVTCDVTNTSTLKLELKNNGLSGKLSEKIADLGYLNVLDLGDNDIKVCFESLHILSRNFAAK